MHRNVAPEQQLQPGLFEDELKQPAAARACQDCLWEKEHADAVSALCAQIHALLLRERGKQPVRDLKHDADAVARFTGGVAPRAVAELFHDAQRVRNRAVRLCTAEIHNGADAAGIMLKSGIV